MNIRWTTCQGCGKRTYETRRDAKKAARDYLPAHHISAYTACSGVGWHAGHLPARVLVGDTTRTAYYQDGAA
jgi:hypothetical protein